MSAFENWIHAEIQQDTGKPDITRSDIDAYQLRRLNETIRYTKENSPFYRDLLADIDEIDSLDELGQIPLTTPEDLAQQPYRLLCLSQSQIARTFCHFTTGTMTGRPKKIFFTHKDADAIVDSMAAIMETVMGAVGLEITDRKVHIFLPNNGKF